MNPPAELLERALVAHGDTLYRLALLAGGDESAAEALLRALAVDLAAAWRESPPLAPPAEPELLAGLARAARAAEAKDSPRKGTRARQPLAFGPFGVRTLPLDQRLALGLFALLGYDAPRIAAVTGTNEEVARSALTAAVRALGPAAGQSLPDRVSGDLCLPVRAALTDPSSGARNGAAVRGHLATCALCRSYDQAWAEIVHAVEDQLRAALRDRTLPPTLAARLVALTEPTRRRISPSLRLALPPLAVLALIGALVLPGFFQAPVSVVEHGEAAPVDPRQLLARAIDRQAAPPDRGGVWYGRYETQWFFEEGVYAPLTAEVWLDPRNPARHRLQLTHADGGAPYELQLGNGRDRLYYALDASYAPAIYGNLPTRARTEEPALVSERLDPDAQRLARDERLATGPWAIAPDYLRQAQSATDLRVLGRQRDDGRTVQILSFSGVSPLGLPPDAPGATAERVTVLLALDEDGLLRSATELSGPAGAEQVSRVTWRLAEEQWLATGQQIEQAFDIGRAWTGMGDFSEVGRHESADPALPLIPAWAVGDPVRLLGPNIGPLWMPAEPPAGIERALLLWSEDDARRGALPQGIVYLGPGRRLVLVYNRNRPLEGEELRAGVWSGVLRPGPTQRYSIALSRPREAIFDTSYSTVDPSANVLIDAYGFTRDELLAVTTSMRPLDLAGLAAQDELFSGRGGSSEARALLLQVAMDTASPPEGQALYMRARRFSRQGEIWPGMRDDPYRGQPYEGRPPVTVVEEWTAVRGGPVRYIVSSASEGDQHYSQSYVDDSEAWHYLDGLNAGYRYSTSYIPISSRLPYPSGIALDLLSMSEGELELSQLRDGGSRISRSEPTEGSLRYSYLLNADPGGEPYIADLQPITMTTELQLSAAGEPKAVRVYALGQEGRRDIVVSYEVLERGNLPIGDAPGPVRDGAVPEEALYVADYRDYAEGDVDTSLSLVARTLSEALALSSGDVYLLADGEPLYVEDGPLDAQYRGSGDVLSRAVGERLAMRYTYSVPRPGGSSSFMVRLTQGPAGPFGALLRIMGLQWSSSEQARLTVAGREVDAWIGRAEASYVVAEVDGTLIVLDAPREWLDGEGRAALAGLRLAERP